MRFFFFLFLFCFCFVSGFWPSASHGSKIKKKKTPQTSAVFSMIIMLNEDAVTVDRGKNHDSQENECSPHFVVGWKAAESMENKILVDSMIGFLSKKEKRKKHNMP